MNFVKLKIKNIKDKTLFFDIHVEHNDQPIIVESSASIRFHQMIDMTLRNEIFVPKVESPNDICKATRLAFENKILNAFVSMLNQQLKSHAKK